MAGEAIELLHTYSLVHDDLPAMDDDDLRRGQPTLHCAFDEATAILAGDGLQAAAFQRLVEIDALSPEQRLEILRVVSIAVGFQGMVGGQALDLAAEHHAVSAAALKGIHDLKTGALISAAAEVGAICADASSAQREALVRFAKAIGLAFQVTDDVLDVTGDSASLGKTAGKDERAEKSTYVSTLGLDGAQQEADRLLDEALEALSDFGDSAAPLRDLAQKMVHRQT
jgi:geranylgeranyl pyrophosphate synthase